MLEKRKKPREIDALIEYLNTPGGENPMELTEQQMKLRERVSFAHNLFSEGHDRQHVVKKLIQTFRNENTGRPIDQSTAYRIIQDCQLLFGAVNVSRKEYDRAIIRDFILKNLRAAWASSNLQAAERAVAQLIKITGVGLEDGGGVPKDALDRLTVIFTVNPEDVGHARMSAAECDAFYQQLMNKPAPKTIDITPNEQDGDTEA